MLACFLVYHSVPTPAQLAAGHLEGEIGVWALRGQAPGSGCAASEGSGL